MLNPKKTDKKNKADLMIDEMTSTTKTVAGLNQELIKENDQKAETPKPTKKGSNPANSATARTETKKAEKPAVAAKNSTKKTSVSKTKTQVSSGAHTRSSDELSAQEPTVQALAPELKVQTPVEPVHEQMIMYSDGIMRKKPGRKPLKAGEKKQQVVLTLEPKTIEALKKWAEGKPRTFTNYISEFVDKNYETMVKSFR